ncbi:MAG: hypothetical protein ACXIVQ_11120 [Acidimicrobiales bacterium]
MSDTDPQDQAEQLDTDKLGGMDDPAEDPDFPPDEPLAVEEYGTTPAEARTDEPLEERLAREEPDDV